MSLIKSNRNRTNGFPGLFDDFFGRDLFDWNLSNFSNTGTTMPGVNIKETADNYQVEMAAPGMTKKDFKVELEGNLLTISSEKKKEFQEGSESEKYTRKEFSYESFQRSFTLPKDVVDADKIVAKYEDGVLHLMIPKKEEAKQKQPRMIQIS
jgi:HSP20 family protein